MKWHVAGVEEAAQVQASIRFFYDFKPARCTQEASDRADLSFDDPPPPHSIVSGQPRRCMRPSNGHEGCFPVAYQNQNIHVFQTM